MRPRSPPAWAGRREGSFHGHEGEVVTLTRGCIITLTPALSRQGRGGRTPISIFPPNGGRGGSPCPSAPLDSGPVSSTGQALRREAHGGVSWPSPVKGPSQGEGLRGRVSNHLLQLHSTKWGVSPATFAHVRPAVAATSRVNCTHTTGPFASYDQSFRSDRSNQ